MEGENIIEFGGNLPELGEVGPGDVGEIVVLIVVSNVEAENVQGSVIRVSLISRGGERNQ